MFREYLYSQLLLQESENDLIDSLLRANDVKRNGLQCLTRWEFWGLQCDKLKIYQPFTQILLWLEWWTLLRRRIPKMTFLVLKQSVYPISLKNEIFLRNSSNTDRIHHYLWITNCPIWIGTIPPKELRALYLWIYLGGIDLDYSSNDIFRWRYKKLITNSE